MLDAFQQRKKLFIQILIGFLVVLIGGAMIITMVPGNPGAFEDGGMTLATVDRRPITILNVQDKLREFEQGGRQQLPPEFRALYAGQIFEQLIDERILEAEADRLGMQVTDEERRARIEELLPTVFVGQTFMGADRYATEVQMRFGRTVPQFEQVVGQLILQEKFRRLVTDGIAVTPAQVEQEFRRQNEKVKLEYLVISPVALAPRINPSAQELGSFFETNKSRYVVPERRRVSYMQLTKLGLRDRVKASDEDLRRYYTQNSAQYRLQDRVNASRILFRTMGKPDAEIAETRKKAEGVLAEAKRGVKFEELAKKHSEDPTKDKGGEMGWLVRGQAPDLEAAVFSLPKGGISDLIQTEYGLQIIRVNDREVARTRAFEEVKEEIRAVVVEEKLEEAVQQAAEQLASAVRQSNRRPIGDVAKEMNLTVEESPALERGDVAMMLGQGPGLDDMIFVAREGDLAGPVQTDRGFLVFTVTGIEPAHAGTLAEVRDRVLQDYRQEKSVDTARKMAETIAQRVKSGESLAQAGKIAAAEAQTSTLVTRTQDIAGLGMGSQVPEIFRMKPGQTGGPKQVGANWAIFKVLEFEAAKMEELEAKRAEITQRALGAERTAAFEAFMTALRERMTREGKVKVTKDLEDRLRTLG